MSLLKKLFLCSILFVFCGIFTNTNADPIIITSGSASQSDNNVGFSISAENNSRFIAAGDRNPFARMTFLPGSTFPGQIDLLSRTGFVGGQPSVLPGFYQANGIVTNADFDNSSMIFNFESFQLPAVLTQTFTTQIPFNMQGLLSAIGSCSTGNNPLCGIRLPDVQISGSGIATFSFTGLDGKYNLRSMDFAFSKTPEPTPEPITILLFGSGIAGVAAYTIKRKRKKEASE